MICFKAAEIPEIRPPPPIGTIATSISGKFSIISKPQDAEPKIIFSESKGCNIFEIFFNFWLKYFFGLLIFLFHKEAVFEKCFNVSFCWLFNLSNAIRTPLDLNEPVCWKSSIFILTEAFFGKSVVILLPVNSKTGVETTLPLIDLLASFIWSIFGYLVKIFLSTIYAT